MNADDLEDADLDAWDDLDDIDDQRAYDEADESMAFLEYACLEELRDKLRRLRNGEPWGW